MPRSPRQQRPRVISSMCKVSGCAYLDVHAGGGVGGGGELEEALHVMPQLLHHGALLTQLHTHTTHIHTSLSQGPEGARSSRMATQGRRKRV